MAHCSQRALRIEPDEVHVWRATDDSLSAEFETFMPLLSPDEQVRADAFKFEPDRIRFICCRGALRRLLGRYTGSPPGEIAFTCGPFGKPSIAPRSNDTATPLHFNLSHTKGMALLAFCGALPVGIDVEIIDPGHDWESTARRFFHPGEWARLNSQPASLRTKTGYTLWTSKEACLKATGAGIGGGLETFEIIAHPACGGEMRIDLPKESPAGELYLRPLEVGARYAAALATLGRPVRCGPGTGMTEAGS